MHVIIELYTSVMLTKLELADIFTCYIVDFAFLIIQLTMYDCQVKTGNLNGYIYYFCL